MERLDFSLSNLRKAEKSDGGHCWSSVLDCTSSWTHQKWIRTPLFLSPMVPAGTRGFEVVENQYFEIFDLSSLLKMSFTLTGLCNLRGPSLDTHATHVCPGLRCSMSSTLQLISNNVLQTWCFTIFCLEVSGWKHSHTYWLTLFTYLLIQLETLGYESSTGGEWPSWREGGLKLKATTSDFLLIAAVFSSKCCLYVKKR